MKRFLIGFGMFMLVLGLAGTAAATIINFDYQVMPDLNSLTSIYTNNVETFESGMPPNYDGDGEIVTGSVLNVHAAPIGVTGPDTTKYLVVPKASLTSGTVTITFGQTYNYLGLWWGSIDDYNAIFFNNGVQVASYTGSDIANPAHGSESKYVNFLDLPAFNQVVLHSDYIALEIDNLAVDNLSVPEPATMLTLGLALLGLAGLKRKFEL